MPTREARSSRSTGWSRAMARSTSEPGFGNLPPLAEPNNTANCSPRTVFSASDNRSSSMRLDICPDLGHKTVEIIKTLGDDAIDNRKVNLFVLMHEDIPEPDHAGIGGVLLHDAQFLKFHHHASGRVT